MYLKLFLIMILYFMHLILFPWLISKEVSFNDVNINMLVAYLIMFYATFKLGYLSFKNEQRLLELTFWIFVYIWMGLAPFGNILTGKYAWGDFYNKETEFFGLILVVIGLISYEVGVFIEKQKKGSDKKSTIIKPNITRQWIYFISIASIILSLLLTFALGGLSVFFATRGEINTIYSNYSTSDRLLIDNLRKVPLLVCLSVAVFLHKIQKVNNKKTGYVFLITLLVIMNLIISNPITNARYWFGAVAITICLLFFRWGKRTMALWSVGISTMMLLIFPYADLFRRTEFTGINIKTFAYQLTQKGDYDAFQQILNTIRYVNFEGITWGHQLLGSLLFWVPRSLWESKPNGSGQLVGEYLGYGMTNLSSPLWAESYINFGLLGIVVIFFIYGYFSSYIQRRYIDDLKSNTASFYSLIIPFLAGYQLFLLRGDLLNGIAYMSVYIVLAYLLQRYSPIKKYKIVW